MRIDSKQPSRKFAKWKKPNKTVDINALESV